MSKRFPPYDVFLSYNIKDKLSVHELTSGLEGSGLHVWLHEREIKHPHSEEALDEDPSSGPMSNGNVISGGWGRPVHRWRNEVKKALERSRAVVFAVSANTQGSDGMGFEVTLALSRLSHAPSGIKRWLVLVRLDDIELEEELRQLGYVDWRKNSGKEYARLISACRHGTQPAISPLAALARVFGALLRDRCLTMGCTSEDLATLSDIEVGKVSELLSGESPETLKVSIREMERLSMVADIRLDKLLTWF